MFENQFLVLTLCLWATCCLSEPVPLVYGDNTTYFRGLLGGLSSIMHVKFVKICLGHVSGQ